MVRRSVPGEEAVVRELRLTALRWDPDAFSSTIDLELRRRPEEWATWVDPGPTFLALEEGAGGAVGLAGAIGSSTDPRAVELVGLWVAPLARRSGAGSALVEAVVHHAVEQGADRVLLGVAIGNDDAERLYERHGFVRTGRVARAIRPGVTEVEMVLDLGRAG